MPEKRLPAIADRAEWEKTTRGRAGIRWNNVVKKIWKGLGDRSEVLSIEKFDGSKTEVKERIEEMEKLALRNMVNEEERLRDIRGVEGIYWNENVSARPNGLREKAEPAISCRAPEPYQKKERDVPVVGRRTWMHICGRVAQQQ